MQKLFDATGMSFSTITSLEKEDLIRVAELSEPNPLAQILLRGNLLSIKSQLSPTSNPIPAEVNNDPVETEANSQSQVTTSTDSTFGSVVFPPKTDKVRDTNRWPLVIGRRYKGTSDPIPISAFCNQLISIGIREAASNVEFFRFVLGNLETSITYRQGKLRDCFFRRRRLRRRGSKKRVAFGGGLTPVDSVEE